MDKKVRWDWKNIRSTKSHTFIIRLIEKVEIVCEKYATSQWLFCFFMFEMSLAILEHLYFSLVFGVKIQYICLIWKVRLFKYYTFIFKPLPK